MKPSALAGAALAMGLAAGPAFAADAQASPEALALARRYEAAVHMDRVLTDMAGALAPMLVEQQAKEHPDLDAAQRQAIVDSVKESVVAVGPALGDRFGDLIARTFSVEELRGLVAFYEGPTGRAVVDKMPSIMAQMPNMVRDIQPAIEAEMKSRLCKKTDCAALDRAMKSKS